MENKIYLYEYRVNTAFDFSSLIKNVPKVKQNEDLKESLKTEMAHKALDFYLLSKKFYTAENPLVGELMSIGEECDSILYSGESSLFGGYFCSDPVLDLVVGNTKRGKQVKNSFAAKYTYYFRDDRLVKSKSNASSVILYFYDDENNTVYEVDYSFADCDFIRYIVKCEYDECGRIAKRTRVDFNEFRNIYFSFAGNGLKYVIKDESKGLEYIFEIEEKIYSYKDDRLVSVEKNEYHSVSDVPHAEQYKFMYNGDYFDSYSLFDYVTSRSYTANVLKKRKFNEFITAPKYSDYGKQCK